MYTTKFNETLLRRLKSEIDQDFVNNLLSTANIEILNYKSNPHST